jgi:predicted acylesterase/phospholipase RssA
MPQKPTVPLSRRDKRRWLPLLLAASIGLAWVTGCADSNRALNDVAIPLESRVRNHTRAATFAVVSSPSVEPESDLSSRSEIRPTPATAPAAATGPVSGLAGAPVEADSLPPDNDGCFVGLALSGGGSRSANFSAACMFQLERLGLLQRVDYISSASGGSLPAAYYCCSGPDRWNPAAVQKTLTHSFASDLIHETFLPWDFAALAFTDYNRSDILAGIFQRQMFSRDGRALTYADLRSDRPRLLVNATDLQSGRRFVFCNESFNQINSDLSKYPLAYAVAASSAVPIVMPPVTLRDYSTIFAQFRHLIDAGIADNLGVETLVETFSAQVDSARTNGRPDPYPKGAVLIVVDSHTNYDAALSSDSDIGVIATLKAAVGLSSTSLLNRASSATLADLIVRRAPDDASAAELRADIDRLNTSGYLTLKDKTGHTVRVVYLALSQVSNLSSAPFASFGESVNSIGTYFDIREVDAYYLYQAAELLVRERFQAPLRDLVRELWKP